MLDADRVLATVLAARIDRLPGDNSVAAPFEAHLRREIEWFRGRAVATGHDQVVAHPHPRLTGLRFASRP